jgi:hypothetical protein
VRSRFCIVCPREHTCLCAIQRKHSFLASLRDLAMAGVGQNSKGRIVSRCNGMLL